MLDAQNPDRKVIKDYWRRTEVIKGITGYYWRVGAWYTCGLCAMCCMGATEAIGIKKAGWWSNWFFPIFFFWLELKESKFFWRRSYWSIDAWWLPSQSQGFLPCSQLPPQPLLPKNFLRRIHRVFEFFFVYWQGSLPEWQRRSQVNRIPRYFSTNRIHSEFGLQFFISNLSGPSS